MVRIEIRSGGAPFCTTNDADPSQAAWNGIVGVPGGLSITYYTSYSRFVVSQIASGDVVIVIVVVIIIIVIVIVAHWPS